jgi:hypothetical protein
MRRVKTFLRADQERRAHVYQRDDGLFSFVEEYIVKDWPRGPRWVPLPPYSSFCDTAETAEREARATIPWLREELDDDAALASAAHTGYEALMQADEIAATFTTLSPNGKAAFLTGIAYEETIHARAAYLNYAKDPTDVDGTALRLSNEFIHRLCGYALQCLRGNTTAEQDTSVVAMILDVRRYSLDDLSRWIAEAQTSN